MKNSKAIVSPRKKEIKHVARKIDNHTSFSELIEPIRKCVDHFYTLKRTGKRSFNYESNGGYDLHFSVGATCNIDFSQEGLRYDSERDRKPIDVILRAAYQLGFSRGQVELYERIELLNKIIQELQNEKKK